MVNTTLLSLALRTSVPVMLGYVPLGIAFGVLFAELGYHWFYAGLMGVIVFAGTAQFLAVGLLANQAGLVEVFTATLLLNIRHVFYGLSLLNRFPSRGWRRWYMIFGLTDETYSLLTATKAPDGVDPVNFKFLITLFNQASWVIGCFIGGWLGSQITFSTLGIEFALPALFTVLVMEQYRQIRSLSLLLTAAIIGVGTLTLISQEHMLLISCSLAVALLLAGRGFARD